MSVLDRFMGLLQDPPPEFVFEIAADGITMSRTRPPALLQHASLAPGVLAPSPVKENMLDPVAFGNAVRKVAPPPSGRGSARSRRGAALILPDNSVRIAVLDFDTLPEKEDERRSLINFRLRKSVPFDIDEAALSWFPQAGKKVLVVLTPAEIIARYEGPFRAAGFQPGLVTVSSLAMLELLPAAGSLLVAHRSPGALTVLALKDGVITIARTLELTGTPDPLEEICSDLYPTMTYIEDQSGARPERLFLAGFGTEAATAAARLSAELDVAAEAIPEPHPGLAGYLKSLGAKAHKPASQAVAA